jgi:hypothetical protein
VALDRDHWLRAFDRYSEFEGAGESLNSRMSGCFIVSESTRRSIGIRLISVQ